MGNANESPVVGEASALFNLGCEHFCSKRFKEALSAFDQAQAIDPYFPYLRSAIAATHFALGNYSQALDLFEAIVRDTPEDVNAWADICASAHILRQWDKSLAAGERAFALNPNHPGGLFSYAIILNEFRRFKRARHLMGRAVSLDPENEHMRSVLALTQLAEGDYKNGWKLFEAHWSSQEHQKSFSALADRWTGESLSQKILIIWPLTRQGHGDSILFVRYMSALAERAKREDGRIVLCCPDPLFTLFSRSLADHSNVLFVAACSKGVEPHHFLGRSTVQCSLMFLPLWFGDTPSVEGIPSKFPYLTPDPSRVDAWRERLTSDKDLKIGFSWSGRPDHQRNDLRSFPILELVNRLKDIPGVTFYSLQVSRPDQAEAARLVDFTRQLGSFDDTAALMCNLDLVIAMDGVIAHLAGALNIPTWVLVDVNPYWGWGRYGRDSIWYRSVRIYRQEKMHDWTSVLEEIRSDLCTHAGD